MLPPPKVVRGSGFFGKHRVLRRRSSSIDHVADDDAGVLDVGAAPEDGVAAAGLLDQVVVAGDEVSGFGIELLAGDLDAQRLAVLDGVGDAGDRVAAARRRVVEHLLDLRAGEPHRHQGVVKRHELGTSRRQIVGGRLVRNPDLLKRPMSAWVRSRSMSQSRLPSVVSGCGPQERPEESGRPTWR